MCEFGDGKCCFWEDYADVLYGRFLSTLSYGISLKFICSIYLFSRFRLVLLLSDYIFEIYKSDVIHANEYIKHADVACTKTFKTFC